MQTQFQYHPGFGSEISSEALPDALPKGQVGWGNESSIVVSFPDYFSPSACEK